jgi:septum formation protein
MTKIVLASQSPRRSKLMTDMGLHFDIQPSDYDEQLDESRDVNEVAIELSLGKALAVAKLHPEAFVIGSDTIVGIDDRQLGKASTVDEARSMLEALVGKQSTITSGVAVVNLSLGIQATDVDVVKIYFKPDDTEVARFREEYLLNGSWQDKAGAFGIQDGAGPMIEKIDGDFSTVMGLPTLQLAKILGRYGITANPVDIVPPVKQVG